MRKVLFFLIFLTVFSAVSISAWEPNDLTKFPPCMTEENWILNLGVGLNLNWIDNIGNEYYYLPKIRLSFDKNVALGDNKLPFFFGGLVGYTGYGYDHKDYGWYHHRIPVGFRAGYHFNWGVDKLDTYAVTTVGYTFGFTGSKDYKYKAKFSDDFFTGVNIGAIWFVSDGFGFWAEAGYIGDLSIDIGLSFKF